MSRNFVMLGISSVIFLCYCTSSRTVAVAASPAVPEKAEVTVTYAKHIEPVLMTYCMPCHFPDTDGKDGPLNTYDTVRAQINDIIYRIELQPHERGFMPAEDKKLPDSTIRLFHQWKKQGMLK